MRHPFTLLFQLKQNNEVLVTVFQRPFPASRNGRAKPATPICSLHGLALSGAWDALLDILRTEHLKPPTLPIVSQKRLGLSEEAGIRLSVLFQALAPLSNLDQIRLIGQGISAMSPEETYYWFAKAYGPTGQRGIRALQVLLGVETIEQS